MPTVEELTTLLDYGKTKPRMDIKFQNSSPLDLKYDYWTANTLLSLKSYAMVVNYEDGSLDSATKKSPVHVRCVRGGNLPSSTISRNESKSVVVDSRTELVWQDDEATSGMPNTKNWESAITYCENLNLAGRDDWRLSNINELMSISDYNRSAIAIKDPFKFSNVSDKYWSSTSVSTSGGDMPLSVAANLGTMINTPKSDSCNVRCVADQRI